jgi:hypothetical protein
MKKILNFIDTWGVRLMFPLVFIVFFQTCNTKGKINKVEDNLNSRINAVDSTFSVKIDELPKETLSKEDIVELIEETPSWKTLELEELSDKNRIPINQLKNEHENK